LRPNVSVRRIFDGTILMAGSISTGAAIRAAEILGADLAYMGTRFIATREAAVNAEYTNMLTECHSKDLMFTPNIAGVGANWFVPSMEKVGLDPKDLPKPQGHGMSYKHLPEGVKPWKNLWSGRAGDLDLGASGAFPPRICHGQ
jgi:nitronate monooxygenase